MSSFMNPEVDANSHGSSLDRAYQTEVSNQKKNNEIINVSNGSVGGGRTINVPKIMHKSFIPDSSYNGAVTIGEPCVGSHCSIPITPSSDNLINHNLKTSHPPPRATINYPGTERIGNNSTSFPGIHNYRVTNCNMGPFQIQCGSGTISSSYLWITDYNTKKRYKTHSKEGKQIIKNLLKSYYEV